jgi:DNA helicase II / ATP-dependent DNA helicase PcrA
VGDEKQGIFRFQGASLENFLYFEDRFKGTTTIALTENYRSGQYILDLAHSLITVDSGPLKELRVPLVSTQDRVATVESRTFSHQAIEDGAVISMVETCIKNGVEAAEIAIVVRTNREVEALAEQLRKRGIRAHASAESDMLFHPLMRGVRDLISFVVDCGSEESLFRVLHGAYWGIPPSDTVRILSARTYNQSLTSILADKVVLRELGVQEVECVQHILATLESVREKQEVSAPQRTLEHLLKESGFVDHALAHDPIESGRFIRRIYDEVELMVRNDGVTTLRAVRDAFDVRSAHNLPLMAPFIDIDSDAVQVMTAHKSKGLEFAHVFIPHLTDSAWGGRARASLFDIPVTHHLNVDDFDALDDERRLLYVAMTRAKEGLYLSSSSVNAEGKEMLPSRLLEELDATKFTTHEVGEAEASFNPLRDMGIPTNINILDPLFLRNRLLERGLSATALNNYLKSPWNYFYRNVLRIPETQSLTLQFGTAVHAVLEAIVKQHTESQNTATDSDIKKLLERELGKLPLSEHEYVRLHERGLSALLTYIPWSARTIPKKTQSEFSLKVMLSTGDPEIPEILLTGKLDRLDFDERGHVVRVVDYKTGKPKSRGYIEGTTKDSNGDYKRQLVFYALLLSLYEDERFKTRDGTLSFVEADGKGEIHEESYTITEEEIETLKLEILQVVREIANGAFLNAPCDAKSCDYCELVEILKRH